MGMVDRQIGVTKLFNRLWFEGKKKKKHRKENKIMMREYNKWKRRMAKKLIQKDRE